MKELLIIQSKEKQAALEKVMLLFPESLNPGLYKEAKDAWMFEADFIEHVKNQPA